VVSRAAVTMRPPSGEKAAELNGPRWPSLCNERWTGRIADMLDPG
jgi:hypothetical protein